MVRTADFWFGKTDAEDNFKEIRTKDDKVHLYLPEMEDWLREITPHIDFLAHSSLPIIEVVYFEECRFPAGHK